MIQNSLEIRDVPRVRKLQRVKGFEENSFCMWRDGRNVCPGHVNREGKDVVVAFVAKKIDEHRSPCARANYTAEVDFVPDKQRQKLSCGSERFAHAQRTDMM
jgi:hypothetical protein